jgi:hypothetical protein
VFGVQGISGERPHICSTHAPRGKSRLLWQVTAADPGGVRPAVVLEPTLPDETAQVVGTEPGEPGGDLQREQVIGGEPEGALQFTGTLV